MTQNNNPIVFKGSCGICESSSVEFAVYSLAEYDEALENIFVCGVCGENYIAFNVSPAREKFAFWESMDKITN